VPVAAVGMGSSGSGTMQGFGNTAFAPSSKFAAVSIYMIHWFICELCTLYTIKNV